GRRVDLTERRLRRAAIIFGRDRQHRCPQACRDDQPADDAAATRTENANHDSAYCPWLPEANLETEKGRPGSGQDPWVRRKSHHVGSWTEPDPHRILNGTDARGPLEREDPGLARQAREEPGRLFRQVSTLREPRPWRHGRRLSVRRARSDGLSQARR